MAIATITYQNVMDAARVPLNDAAKVRYTDDELLGYLNDALLALAQLRPDLFTQIGEITCVRHTTEQLMPPGAIALYDVYAVKNGRGVARCEFDVLRTFRPTWRTDAAGPAQNWFLLPNDVSKQNHLHFGIYPQAPSNQVLIGQWAQTPSRVSNLATTLPVIDAYSPALQAYVIFRAESKDDEHINSNRAALFFTAFQNAVKEAQVAEVAAP